MKKIEEDLPTNAMGDSSAFMGPIQVYDPLLKNKQMMRRHKPIIRHRVLRKLKHFMKKE